MKFPQVSIGQRFAYQGRQYTKTGPLTASEEGTGQNRLIMKSAEVSLLDGPGGGQPQAQKRNYSREEVETLLGDYRSALQKALLEAVDAKGALDRQGILELIGRQPLFDRSE